MNEYVCPAAGAEGAQGAHKEARQKAQGRLQPLRTYSMIINSMQTLQKVSSMRGTQHADDCIGFRDYLTPAQSLCGLDLRMHCRTRSRSLTKPLRLAMLQSWRHGTQQTSRQTMQTRLSWRPLQGCTTSNWAPTRSKQRQLLCAIDICSVLKALHKA